MKSRNRFNRYDEDPEQSLISKLVSGLGEDMLRRVAIGVILASRSTRSLLIKLLMTSFLLGVSTTVVVILKAPSFFDWLSTFWR
jgi:hypothetical protein